MGTFRKERRHFLLIIYVIVEALDVAEGHQEEGEGQQPGEA